MALPDLETVQTALKPLEALIISAYRRAWEDWRNASLTHWRPRGRANYVWEQAAHYAVTDAAAMANVVTILKNESYHFLVDGAVSFRLKKADQAGFTSNYPTQEAMTFHDPQLPLSGVPAEHRVEVVYALNASETDIKEILVVARDGDAIAWSYSIVGNDMIIALPTMPSPDHPTDQGVRTGLVRAKGRDKQHDSTGETGEA